MTHSLSRLAGRTLRRSSPPNTNVAIEKHTTVPELSSAQASPFQSGFSHSLAGAALLSLALVPGVVQAAEIDLRQQTDKVDLQKEQEHTEESGLFRQTDRGMLRPNMKEPESPEEAEAYAAELEKAELPNRVLKRLIHQTEYLKDFDNTVHDLNTQPGIVVTHNRDERSEDTRVLKFDIGSGQVQSFETESVTHDSKSQYETQLRHSYHPGPNLRLHSSYLGRSTVNPAKGKTVELSLEADYAKRVHFRFQSDSSNTAVIQQGLPTTASEAYKGGPRGGLVPDISEPETLQEARAYGRLLETVAPLNKRIDLMQREIETYRNLDQTDRDLNSTPGLVVVHRSYDNTEHATVLNFDPETNQTVSFRDQRLKRLEKTTMDIENKRVEVEGYSSRRVRSYLPGEDFEMIVDWNRSVESHPELNRQENLTVKADKNGQVFYSPGL